MKSIKSKSVISEIFRSGKSITSDLVFAKVLESDNGFVFAVSSKKFKRAVDRNRIKRLMRESVKNVSINKSIALIYIGDKVPTLFEINKSIKNILKNI